MLCLGIESTAHTFGIGIVDSKGKIIANVSDSYKTEKGGIIPIEAAKHHAAVKMKVIEGAFKKLKEADINVYDIKVIAYSQGPGLAPCLLEGLKCAKELAKKMDLPLVGVNHCIAHLEIGKLLTQAKDPVYLFTSGANTQVIALASEKYRIFGETLDTGIGNALDKFGRTVGLGFPAGPKIEELAKEGSYIELPYSVKGMDVSFSGIITDVINKFKKDFKKEDLCFSLQETCFAMLAEVTERALAHTGKKELLLIGGVAANKRFCEILDTMCKERNAKFFNVPLEYSGDNGAMIAWLGILAFKAGQKISIEKANINPYERVDDVKVIWNK